MGAEAKRVLRDVIGTRAGYKTVTHHHDNCIKELVRRAKAYDKIQKLALDENLSNAEFIQAVLDAVDVIEGDE